MSVKKAFVFDTNFMLENKNLAEVVTNIPDEYTIYVTQVSIDERISQKYLARQKKAGLAALANEYKGVAKGVKMNIAVLYLSTQNILHCTEYDSD